MILLQEIDKCLAILTELENMQMTYTILKRNPDIMATVKKVGNTPLFCFFA
jgi:hypothetical protein